MEKKSSKRHTAEQRRARDIRASELGKVQNFNDSRLNKKTCVLLTCEPNRCYLVGQNVAKDVAAQNRVELLGPTDQLHRRVVHVHVAQLDGVLRVKEKRTMQQTKKSK